MIYGVKMLTPEGTSLREEGRVFYPVDEWVEVKGNGAYIAREDNVDAGGWGVLCWFQCEDEIVVDDAPKGVECFRRVKRLSSPPPIEDVDTNYLRALHPDLPAPLLKVLARDKDFSVRGVVAQRPDLPAPLLEVLAKDEHYPVRRAVAKRL